MTRSNQPLRYLAHRGFVEINECHGSARLGKCFSRREPHAGGRAGDKRDLAFK